MTLTTYDKVDQGDVARFNKFVPRDLSADECWEWQSTRNNSGYGKFWLDGRTDLAHRVAYRIANGPIPLGLSVRHACDNKPCVNPAHLLVGTVKDNAQDAVERGRYRRGAANGTAKLTDDAVRDIRRRWHLGETQVSMAQHFGVSRAAIQFVLSGKNWAHVGGAA